MENEKRNSVYLKSISTMVFESHQYLTPSMDKYKFNRIFRAQIYYPSRARLTASINSSIVK